jgi:lipoate-protein ligase A
MAVDGLLLERVAGSGHSPVLRFYAWHPPAVSIGYNQSALNALDLAKCRHQRIDVVTRPSGGRAVLHWNELTYSLLWPDDEPVLAGGISASSRRIGQSLVEGLRLFGVAAELEPGARTRGGSAVASSAKGPCFASTSRWEVKCGGKKLVGSAQRRIRGGVLQHGSLLLGPEHERLAELMQTRHVLPRTSTHLSRWIDDIDLARLRECLVEGFERTLGVRLEPDDLSYEETATAAKRAHRFSVEPPLRASDRRRGRFRHRRDGGGEERMTFSTRPQGRCILGIAI